VTQESDLRDLSACSRYCSSCPVGTAIVDEDEFESPARLQRVANLDGERGDVLFFIADRNHDRKQRRGQIAGELLRHGWTIPEN
jgi:hypothetical protein